MTRASARGAIHKTSQAIEALLDGEAEGLRRMAVDMALQGDTTAMRLCLERVCPPRKDTPVQFDLPPMERRGRRTGRRRVYVGVAQGPQVLTEWLECHLPIISGDTHPTVSRN